MDTITTNNEEKNVVSPSSSINEKRLGKRKRYKEEEKEEQPQDEHFLESAKKIHLSNNNHEEEKKMNEDHPIISEPSTSLGMMENRHSPIVIDNNNNNNNNNNKVTMSAIIGTNDSTYSLHHDDNKNSSFFQNSDSILDKCDETTSIEKPLSTQISLDSIKKSHVQKNSSVLLEPVVLQSSSSSSDVVVKTATTATTATTNHDSILKDEKNHNDETVQQIPFTSKKTDESNLDDTSTVDKEKISTTSTITLPNSKEDVTNNDDVPPTITETKEPTKLMTSDKVSSTTNHISPLSFTSSLKQHVKLVGSVLLILIGSYTTYICNGFYVDQRLPVKRFNPHVRPPQKTFQPAIFHNMKSYLKWIDSSNTSHEEEKLEYQEPELSNVTLRQYLSHPEGFHLAMAPAFFGFYAYFGALIAFNEEVLTDDDELTQEGYTILPSKQKDTFDETKCLLKSTVGASAGAMAAVLLASGLDPRTAADFASSLTLSSFADPPGIGGVLKGDMFEVLMKQQLRQQQQQSLLKDEKNSHNLQLENAFIPVAVSAFDLMSMSGRILSKGCIARAARASATFPGLFQPVLWDDHDRNVKEKDSTSLLFALVKEFFSLPPVLIDGGVTDTNGYLGLSAINVEGEKRVVNLVVGKGSIPGPSVLRSNGIQATEVVSITIENSPICGPWAMENGPKAVHAVRQAVTEVLDFPMYVGNEPGHFILHIDTSKFVSST